MSPTEAVIQTFEICAEADIDVTAAVYEAFFAADAKALALMGHSDEPMRGRMLDEVLTLLMSESNEQTTKYLHWEVDNHLLAYGVELTMYEGFFAAVKAAVRSALADRWLPEHEHGWTAKVQQLQDAVHQQAVTL